jgi:16S rRNA processing protein RimM
VESTTGEPLGTIFQVVETGANDVYEVRHEGRTFLVPVVPHIVISVDTEAQKVVIDPIPGLLDEELGK